MPETCAPTLEMLWEGHDPARILSERFGFTNSEAAARWVTVTLKDLWDIEVDGCQRIVMSDSNALAWMRTASGQMVAKWSVAKERFPRLATLARLTTWLDERGLPVSAPIAARDGQGQVEVDGVSLSVQRVKAGSPLDTEDLDHVHEAGAVLARLHDAMASYPGAADVFDTPEPVACRVTSWLQNVPDQVPRTAVDTLRRMATNAPQDASPPQLIHGDFRAANLLCIESGVSAVIDFEEARLDQPIAELARSAVLLGTRFHDWGPVSSNVHQVFLDGYQSVLELTPAERRWWLVLVLWYSAMMIPAGQDQDPTGWESAAAAMLHESDRSPRIGATER